MNYLYGFWVLFLNYQQKNITIEISYKYFNKIMEEFLFKNYQHFKLKIYKIMKLKPLS
jgi:hypothetical protein